MLPVYLPLMDAVDDDEKDSGETRLTQREGTKTKSQRVTGVSKDINRHQREDNGSQGEDAALSVRRC